MDIQSYCPQHRLIDSVQGDEQDAAEEISGGEDADGGYLATDLASRAPMAGVRTPAAPRLRHERHYGAAPMQLDGDLQQDPEASHRQSPAGQQPADQQQPQPQMGQERSPQGGTSPAADAATATPGGMSAQRRFIAEHAATTPRLQRRVKVRYCKLFV